MALLSPVEYRRARWIACGLPVGNALSWPGTSHAAVGRLAAVQAQEFDATLWALSQRTGQTREEIRAEFNTGRFVRTHAMRPTWHFVRREDLARVQAAASERVQRVNAGIYRQVGLDAETLAAWRAWLSGALADGPLTRAQISAALASAGRPLTGLQLIGALMWAELEMIITSGPLSGASHTYRILEPEPAPDRADSIVWLVRAYLESHGPSTVADVAAWSGLKRTDIRAALAAVPTQEAEGPDGTCMWIEGLMASARSGPGVALLNGYDEYISGLSPAGKGRLDPDRLWPGRPGTPVHVLMIDGTLAGHWRRTASRSTTVLDVLPLRPLSEAERDGLEIEAQAYASFAESTVDLRLH